MTPDGCLLSSSAITALVFRKFDELDDQSRNLGFAGLNDCLLQYLRTIGLREYTKTLADMLKSLRQPTVAPSVSSTSQDVIALRKTALSLNAIMASYLSTLKDISSSVTSLNAQASRIDPTTLRLARDRLTMERNEGATRVLQLESRPDRFKLDPESLTVVDTVQRNRTKMLLGSRKALEQRREGLKRSKSRASERASGDDGPCDGFR